VSERLESLNCPRRFGFFVSSAENSSFERATPRAFDRVEFHGASPRANLTSTLRFVGLKRRLSAHIDRFIPEVLLRESPEDAQRARLAVAVGLLLGPVFGVLVLVHLMHGNDREALLNALLGCTMAAVPFVLRITGRYFLLLNAALSTAFALLVAVAVFARGGGMTSATVALAEVPLFATLLGGIRLGAIWAALSIAASLLIGWLGHARVISERVDAEKAFYDDHASLIVITGTLFVIGAMYEFWKDSALRHIAALEEEKARVEREKIRAETDAEVARTERLASMGRLAAAAAHEINNPLSYIANNLDFLRVTLAESHRSNESLDAIQDALDGVSRIRRIVADLGTLSRPDAEHIGLVKVEGAVRMALKMAELHTAPKARIRTHFEPVAAVLANESRLVQVFLNLVLNAAHAIPEGHVDDNEIRISVAPLGTEQVSIEISDSGVGIPRHVLDRIKEPFFTTKPIGEGTGLGLAMCDGIVRRYGGRLEIESDATGTTARVVLEASGQTVHESERPSGVHSMLPNGVKLKVLVIDDDALVARAFARILRGHEVALSSSGRDGLARLIGDAGFDIVFCDMMMPDLSGMDVFDALVKDRADLVPRVVFMTGGTFTDRARGFRERVQNRFIEKPIDAAVVARLLADCAALSGNQDPEPTQRRSVPSPPN